MMGEDKTWRHPDGTDQSYPPIVEDRRKVKRIPVTFLYNKLNWDFLKMMAEIAHYAEEKYGAAEQYTGAELVGEKSPMNHMAEHMRQYLVGEPHDRYGKVEYQLASIAYNAMMEFYYFKCRGKLTDLYAPQLLNQTAENTHPGMAEHPGLHDVRPGRGPRQAQAVIRAAESMNDSLSLHKQREMEGTARDRAESFKRV